MGLGELGATAAAAHAFDLPSSSRGYLAGNLTTLGYSAEAGLRLNAWKGLTPALGAWAGGDWRGKPAAGLRAEVRF